MKKSFVSIVVLLNSTLSAIAATGTTAEVISGTTPGSEFSYQLLNQVSKAHAGKNFAFSPYSIRSALSLAAYGARGRTQKQLGKVTEFPHKLDSPYKLVVASRLWVDMKYPLIPTFMDSSENNLGVRPWMVDFSKAPDFLSDRVNGWVEERTSGKIRGFLSPEMFEEGHEYRMMLSSVLYFQANWLFPFHKKDTKTESFRLNDGNQIQARFVNRKGGFLHFKGNHFQLVDLPYEGTEIAMAVFLPDSDEDLEKLESSLTQENVDHWMAGLALRDVAVSLPKFEFDSTLELSEAVKNLGISDSFNSTLADFSGMNGGRDLYLGKLPHKTLIALNEEGTESLSETQSSPPPVSPLARSIASSGASMDFRANRPFLFLIHHRASQTPLILGRVFHPTEVEAKNK